MPKTLAVVEYLGLRDNAECYKEFKIGKTVHKRYSSKAIEKIKRILKKESAEQIWTKRSGARNRR